MTDRKARIGRPSRSGSAATVRRTIRLTDAELAAWERAAGSRSFSDFVRESINSMLDNRPTKR